MSESPKFGAELRRLRLEAGFTLSDFARAVTYTKGHLSRVERGMKPVSPDLAGRCDALLGAGGKLRRLAERESSRRVSRPVNDPSLVKRRRVLTAGSGSLIGVHLATGQNVSWLGAKSLTSPFLSQLDHMRQLGQNADPAALVPLLEAQTRIVLEFAARSGSRDRTALLVIAARFAEYTGWMAQEAGGNDAALAWTAEAVELAQAGGDHHLASYALVRRALITLYDSDAEHTIALAGQAQDGGLPPRIRGLAAQREAQGHALAGDERACLSSMERARELLASAEEEADGAPTIGMTHVPDPAAMVTGWCLYDLGRPREAAGILDRECMRIAPRALRTRIRYGMRRSLAHAAAGEIEHSCEIAKELLGFAATVPSVTVNADIRRLARELSRFRTNRAVCSLQPALAEALQYPPG
ncbi:helix-turn-helix domain-containing protein [Streptomyces specialis]|uniref:helix-turn-helix domain-containing protein n=1 Tax=Streptomyces specialis TaxID=498367 RepID=UPI00073EF973|nr:helix-turn-helix transcriptional regulator [Streptomyces specialis]